MHHPHPPESKLSFGTVFSSSNVTGENCLAKIVATDEACAQPYTKHKPLLIRQ